MRATWIPSCACVHTYQDLSTMSWSNVWCNICNIFCFNIFPPVSSYLVHISDHMYTIWIYRLGSLWLWLELQLSCSLKLGRAFSHHILPLLPPLFYFLYIPHVFFSLFRQKGFRERQLHVSITYSKYCVINHIVTLWLSFGYPGFLEQQLLTVCIYCATLLLV